MQATMPLRNRRLATWLAGEFISQFGDQFFIIAMAFAATRAGGPGALALILSVGTLPRLFLMLLGGALVDRLDSRRIMIWSDVVRTALAAAITLYSWVGTSNVPVLLVTMLLFSFIGSGFDPASNALPVYIVRGEDLSRLQGIRTTLSRLALIAGAPMGGLVVELGGIPLAFGLDAVSFAFAALAVSALRVRRVTSESPAGAKAGLLRETMDGLRYTLRHPLLRGVVLILAIMEFAFTGPVNIGTQALVLQRDWGPSGFGLILGFFGAGAVVGPITISILGNRARRLGLPALASAAVGCGAFALLGFTSNLAVACAVAACAGVTTNFLAAVFIPILQANAAPAFLGRVMSALSFGFSGLVPLSTALTGILIETWGTTAAIAAGGATAALIALAGLASRHLRQADIGGNHTDEASESRKHVPESRGDDHDLRRADRSAHGRSPSGRAQRSTATGRRSAHPS